MLKATMLTAFLDVTVGSADSRALLAMSILIWQ